MSDKISSLTTDTFKNAIAETSTAVVDFWAPWCAPCRTMGAILEELAGEVDDSTKIFKSRRGPTRSAGRSVQYSFHSHPADLQGRKPGPYHRWGNPKGRLESQAELRIQNHQRPVSWADLQILSRLDKQS